MKVATRPLIAPPKVLHRVVGRLDDFWPKIRRKLDGVRLSGLGSLRGLYLPVERIQVPVWSGR